MGARSKAAFSTALKEKTAIWPGDMVRHDIGGIYIWRPGDTALETPQGNRYLIKNPGGILNPAQMGNIAQDFANAIGLMMGVPVTTITIDQDTAQFVELLMELPFPTTTDTPMYRLGKKR